MNKNIGIKKAFLTLYSLVLSLIALDALLVFLRWLRPIDFLLFFLISITIISVVSFILGGDKFRKYPGLSGVILFFASIAAFFCMVRSFVFRDMVSFGFYHMISLSLYISVFSPAMFLGFCEFLKKNRARGS